MTKSAPAKEVRTGDVFVGVTGRKLFIDCVNIDEVSYHNEDGENGRVSRRTLLDYCNKAMRSAASRINHARDEEIYQAMIDEALK